ncbi:MAG: hypothetical protein PHY12_01595 [Eubacteriales bacterium]|nr:hypothetical protein [Eubacteriales bacterium]
MKRRSDPYYEENREQPYTVEDENGAPYEAPPASDFDEEEYSDYNEELDDTHRFHVAMGVFNTVSVLAGLVVILLLSALLIGLITWLQADITHSFTLFTSKLQ